MMLFLLFSLIASAIYECKTFGFHTVAFEGTLTIILPKNEYIEADIWIVFSDNEKYTLTNGGKNRRFLRK